MRNFDGNREGVLFLSPPYAFLGSEDRLNPDNIPPLVSFGIASIFSYLLAKTRIPCSLYYSTDYSESAIKRVLRQHEPRIIAISGFSFNRFACLALALIAKKMNPSVAVILGGVHATFLDEQVLTNYSCIDFIVRGEGEESFLELVEAIYQEKDLNGILGISWRFKGSVIKSPARPRVSSLDDVPLIDYSKVMLKGDILKVGKQCQSYSTALPVETSRGCVYACSFCSTTGFWERRMTYRSVGRVMDQVKLMPPGHTIAFLDNDITINASYFESLCHALMKQKVNVPWVCGTRTDLTNETTLRLMKTAGCELVFFGMESFSKKILLGVGKKFEPDDALESINMAASLGLKARVSLIIGLPGENEDTLAETIRSCQRLHENVNISVNIARLYPGSSLYQTALKEGFDESYWLKYHKDLCPFYEGALPVNDLRKWEKIFSTCFQKRNIYV